MAEEIQDETARPTEDAAQAAEAEVRTVEDLTAENERLKAESRKWEKRAKDNKDAATRIAEIEAKGTADAEAAEKAKADVERLTKELDELREERRREIAVKTAARAAGVDEDLLAMMQGVTEEEIEANASALKEKLAAFQRYPEVNDGGGSSAPAVTKESILAIDNPNERFEAIKQNASLFRK